MILYRGSIAEAGEVGQVIKNPQHPYTQLLVNSIPWPDIDRKWSESQPLVTRNGDEVKLATEGGCKFADRCPHIMPVCRTAPPPLFQRADRHVAACYLYETSPVVTET
jgi:peptide/nickel transport system ATP-binding protein